MRPKTKSMTLVALDRNGLSASANPGDGANLVLGGDLTSGGAYVADVPRHIAIYQAGDESLITYTVTGTDRYGAAMTEEIVGTVADSTAVGLKNFATVTQIATTGNSGTCEAGTYSSAESQWIPVEYKISSPYQIAITVTDAATLTAQVEYTFEDPFSPGFDEHSCRRFKGIPELPCRAIRMRVDDFTDGTATLTIVCPRC